jgi:hypothetical protein
VSGDALIGRWPDKEATDPKDLFYLFLKLEDSRMGAPQWVGNFVGPTAFGKIIIVLSGAKVEIKQTFFSTRKDQVYRILDPKDDLKLARPGEMVAIMIKFEDETVKSLIVEDKSDYLGLVNRITTLDHCTLCWSESDITDFANWPAKDLHGSQLEIVGRSSAVIYSLNRDTLICELQCGAGNWSN